MAEQIAPPLKYMDLKNMLMQGVRGVTPNSLAFMLPSQIPPVPQNMDPRRIPFNDVSPQLRDQRQLSLANPSQHNPFSAFGAVANVRNNANTPK